jgi:hypothetical protein
MTMNKSPGKKKFTIFTLLLLSLITTPFIYSTLFLIPENGQFTKSPITIGEPFGIVQLGGNEADKANEVGVEIVRCDHSWADMEHSDRNFHFEDRDTYYADLDAQNLEILALLDYGNVPIFGEEYAYHIPPWMVPDWLRFVNESVYRYQDLVDYWEIWNEPNLGVFWSGPETDFFYLLNATAFLIHNNYPDVKIMAPGISGYNPDYLTRMIEYIGAENFNKMFSILAFHPYSRTPEEVFPACQAVWEVVHNFGFSGEVWISEVGFPVDIHNPFEVQYQTESLVKIFAQALVSNITRIVWYNWWEPGFGIYFLNEGSGVKEFIDSGLAYYVMSKLLTNSTISYDRITLSKPIFIDSRFIWIFPFQTTKDTTVLILWSESSNLEVDIDVEPAVTITQYNYGKNTTQIITGTTFPLSLTPIIIELSSDNVDIEIKVHYEASYTIFIIALPILTFISLDLILWNKLKSRKLNTSFENRE